MPFTACVGCVWEGCGEVGCVEVEGGVGDWEEAFTYNVLNTSL